jgi:hypothetical protein
MTGRYLAAWILLPHRARAPCRWHEPDRPLVLRALNGAVPGTFNGHRLCS